jgi:DNA-binding transcriptional LysR family regulator
LSLQGKLPFFPHFLHIFSLFTSPDGLTSRPPGWPVDAFFIFSGTTIVGLITLGAIMDNVRVLRYFVAVAREGSITGAANFLHVTQPTLSRQLKELEEELGKKLFIRSSLNMKLTEEGMLLRKRAEDIIDMVDKTKSEFLTMDEVTGGDVHIGGAETDAIQYVAEVAKDLREQNSKIHYHLYSGYSVDVMDYLDKGLLDFGILVEPVDLAKYNYITLPAKDVWGVIMPVNSPLASKKSIRPTDLIGVPVICSRQTVDPFSSRNILANWFGDHFEKLDIVATYNLIFNASIMVRKGLGYAIGFDKIVNTGSESDLCFRPLRPKVESRLSIAWKKYQVFSKVADLFLKELQKRFTETIE